MKDLKKFKNETFLTEHVFTSFPEGTFFITAGWRKLEKARQVSGIVAHLSKREAQWLKVVDAGGDNQMFILCENRAEWETHYEMNLKPIDVSHNDVDTNLRAANAELRKLILRFQEIRDSCNVIPDNRYMTKLDHQLMDIADNYDRVLK